MPADADNEIAYWLRHQWLAPGSYMRPEIWIYISDVEVIKIGLTFPTGGWWLLVNAGLGTFSIAEVIAEPGDMLLIYVDS